LTISLNRITLGLPENEVEYLKQNLFFDTVIFDLDGTLLNSLQDLAASTNFALCRFGYPQRSIDEVRRFVGNGGRMLITRALPEGTASEEIERVFDVFAGHYELHMKDHTKPYPGIDELLSALSGRGIRMGVVSNKMNDAVVPLIDFWFGRWIKVAVGEGDGIPKKPDPQGVRKALSLLGSAPEHTVYVGDSDVDVATAKNSGAFPVGCSWGFRDRGLLERAGAQLVIDLPKELLKLF